MRSFFRYSILCAGLLFSGCNALKQAEENRAKRRLEAFNEGLRASAPIPADSSGRYPASVELSILDGLLQKYPGRQVTKTVVEVRNVTVPGKTIYVPVAARPDTAANRIERDTILQRMEKLTANEKSNDPLRLEVARLKVRLLAALNDRGYLPDTTIYFPKDSASFTIKRIDARHYVFTCVVKPRTIQVPVTVNETAHTRIAQDVRKYWHFPEFWAAAGLDVVLLILLVVIIYRFWKASNARSTD